MLAKLKNRPRVTGTFGLLYKKRHKRLVSELIADERTLEAFCKGERLAPGFGRGMDERVVEYPWVFSRLSGGVVLDAGSTFNFEHVLDAALQKMDSLSVVTLAPEPRAFPERGVSYVFADLEDLPFDDARFDTCVSISTLEHVGMDNSLYATDAPRKADPDEHLNRALAELRRVLKPAGRLLITVPYGLAEDHGWLRQFDAAMVEEMIATLAPASSETTFFRYAADGWQLSTLAEARSERYYDIHNGSPAPKDGAAAARAVACLDLILP